MQESWNTIPIYVSPAVQEQSRVDGDKKLRKVTIVLINVAKLHLEMANVTIAMRMFCYVPDCK